MPTVIRPAVQMAKGRIVQDSNSDNDNKDDNNDNKDDNNVYANDNGNGCGNDNSCYYRLK